MSNAKNALLVTMSVITAACAASTGQLTIRAIADPAARSGVNGYIAEARGQLALGNPGLALEEFRTALRIQGDSADAFSGIAACYAQMGRYDLARSNYEAALALDPHNPRLLRALATVLDSLGKVTEAAEARADATLAATPRLAALNSTVTVPLPPARAATPDNPGLRRASSAAAAPEHLPQVSSSVALEPASTPAVGPTMVNSTAGFSTARASWRPVVQPRVGPRLERLSSGEVALRTTGAPMWTAQIVSRTRVSTTVRWVPVQAASARPNIRLLNAARSAGLAARSREMLLGRGWRKIEIGNAPAAAHQTVVIYPTGWAALGRSLAAQFNCASRKSGESDVLLVLIGRDRAGISTGKG